MSYDIFLLWEDIAMIGGWFCYSDSVLKYKDILDKMKDTIGSKDMYMNMCVGLLDGKRFVVNHAEFVIAFDGNIYNWKQLQVELSECGIVCNSMQEVVLMAYLQWGVDSFNKLDGVYAFAIYDGGKEELVLVRDSFGVCPLYYYMDNRGVIFGSLLKTLLAHPYVEPILTEEGLQQIFLLGPGKILGSGVFKGVEEILPGEYRIFSKDECIANQYYRLEALEHTESLEETIEHVQRLVEDSVVKQMDGCEGSMLSGGLDSSIVSMLARKCNLNLATYYIRYQDNDKYFKKSMFQPNQDEAYIQMMVDALESNHHIITFNEEDIYQSLYMAMKSRDLPGMADIDGSFYLFTKEIAKDVGVVLSGECSDEIFGGYPWYYKSEFMWKDTFPWMESLDIRKQIIKEGLLKENGFVDKVYKSCLDKVSYLSSDSLFQRRHRELFFLNIYNFMQTLLDRCHRMSSANHLEVRVPFCDKQLVSYCYNIPVEMKFLNGNEKGLLKEAFKDSLPRDIVERKKSPFPKIYHPRYEELVSNRMKEILQEDSLFTYVVNKEVIEQIMDSDEEILWYGQLMRKPQVLAYLLQVDMWFKEYNVRIEL